MLPTPSTSHVNYDRIYEPAEDSFLLLDTLSSNIERTFLQTRFPSSSPSPLVVEVGTGSGVVLAFVHANAQHILGRRDVATLGTDVTAFACKAAAETVKHATVEREGEDAAVFLDCPQADLLTAFRPGTIDLLIFNPPYVPTDALPDIVEMPAPAASASTRFEQDSHLLAYSYAGGTDGMQVTNRLLAQLPSALSERGVAYILLCAQNKPHEVLERIRAWPGKIWSAEIVGSSGKQAGWERLCILRIWRTAPT